jgi:hypothetical protein
MGNSLRGQSASRAATTFNSWIVSLLLIGFDPVINEFWAINFFQDWTPLSLRILLSIPELILNSCNSDAELLVPRGPDLVRIIEDCLVIQELSPSTIKFYLHHRATTVKSAPPRSRLHSC